MRIRSLVAGLFIVAGCGGSDGGSTITTPNTPNTPNNPTPVATTSVNLQNTAFTPSAIQVSKGAVVTFTNLDNFAHNVTFTDASITSTGDFSTGSKTATMPSVAGTYNYRCTLHAGMAGTVTVQ